MELEFDRDFIVCEESTKRKSNKRQATTTSSCSLNL
jgi:hypothetical protein